MLVFYVHTFFLLESSETCKPRMICNKWIVITEHLSAMQSKPLETVRWGSLYYSFCGTLEFFFFFSSFCVTVSMVSAFVLMQPFPFCRSLLPGGKTAQTSYLCSQQCQGWHWARDGKQACAGLLISQSKWMCPVRTMPSLFSPGHL